MGSFETKDSGARAEFVSGMRRDTEEGKARFDLLKPLGVPYSEQMMTRFAELMARGAEKYDARNWEKADSQAELDRYYSSAERHYQQWVTGETDEDHAAAVFFNIMAAETVKYKMRVAKEKKILGRAPGGFVPTTTPPGAITINNNVPGSAAVVPRGAQF